jgi:urease gamma subunit
MLKQARTIVKCRLASRRREPGVRLKWKEVVDTEANAPQTGSSTARSAADLLPTDY